MVSFALRRGSDFCVSERRLRNIGSQMEVFGFLLLAPIAHHRFTERFLLMTLSFGVLAMNYREALKITTASHYREEFQIVSLHF
mgnify:CR=1 FL=1